MTIPLSSIYKVKERKRKRKTILRGRIREEWRVEIAAKSLERQKVMGKGRGEKAKRDQEGCGKPTELYRADYS